MFSGIAFICEFISPELQAISTIWIEEGEWTGNLEKEVENFENILQKVLERVPSEDVERKKKL
ncbi:hypothetical protein RhiirB3_457015 [Rhizophagus irregularis]|nr:hypothetical protein RhiirB3_457015 [Rhizophagus irregularis]